MGPGSNSIGTIGNSRTLAQYQAMKATVGKGICPFCHPETWKNKPLFEGRFWWVKFNDFPYKHHQFHFVLVHKEHGTNGDLSIITPGAWAEFGEMIQRIIAEFQIPGGGIAMRFGDQRFNAGTLVHLHAHLQVPDLTGVAKATFAKDLRNVKRRAKRKRAFRRENEFRE